jgi:predicted ATPase/DNA-binding winged helix-turn-helix (wHTH) protein
VTADDTNPSADHAEVRFGNFRLQPTHRVLLRGDVELPLGNRAFDLLLVLVEHAGDFVSNDELIKRVWPRTVVVEGNLRVHMAALRKALSDAADSARLIVNVPNRGYSFTGIVTRGLPPDRAETPVRSERNDVGALTPLHRIIGRRDAIESLRGHLARHRLVTLVGAGGIGKTTVALSVASERRSDAPIWESVHFVDLAPLSSADLVSSALASALGLPAVAQDAMTNLLAFLHDKAALIVLDNCEHVLSAVPHVVEALLRGAPRLKILATSREPLRAGGEWIQRLQALDLPPAAARLSVAEAMTFGAIELLVERISASFDTFSFEDSDVPAAIEICRRLDGMPLAIELAAARVNPLGLRGVATALDDCFALLSKGRRTAVPRHQTLQATLEWSFRLLSPGDQQLLLRLSVFAGSFTLESATAVAAWGGVSRTDVLEAVSDLASKSLLTTDVSEDEAVFRLLDTTRAYAREQLADSSDAQPIKRRHAEHCLEVLAQSEREWTSAPTSVWRRSFGRRIDDIRQALSWALGVKGDDELALKLTARSAQLFFQMSLAEELRENAERALEVSKGLTAVDPRLEFELNVIHGHVLFHTRGLKPASEQAFQRALALAEASQDPEQRLLAYSSAWMGAYNRGEPAAMVNYVDQFEQAGGRDGDPALSLLFDRMLAPALHFMGDQVGAREAAERALADPARLRPPFLSGSQIDRRVSAGAILGRVLWLQGEAEASERILRQTIDIARQEGESVAVAFVLGFSAVPVAIWSSDWALARERLTLLLRHSAEHSLLGWRLLAQASEWVLNWHERGSASPPFPDSLLREVDANPHFADLLTTMHSAYPGRAALARSEAGHAAWMRPELLRSLAEQRRALDPDAARAICQQAIDLADSQGMAGWSLHARSTLASINAVHPRSS